MSRMKEPLITLSLIVVMLLFEIKPTQLRFLLPSMPHKYCTSIKGMEIRQWFAFLFYHHVDKGHLAYNVLSILWKGVLLEGCIGSRQFSLLILALLFTYDGIIILAGVLWKFLSGVDICLSMCHTGISGLLFALSFLLSTNSETYRSILSGPLQNFIYRVTFSAVYAAEIAFLYHLCPGLPFYGPVCGTLSGFLYSYRSWLFSNWNSWLLFKRRWPHPLLKITRTRDSEQRNETINMVWSCRACTYDNSIADTQYACAICNTPRFEITGSSESDLNPDKAALVWNCPTCTYENGVYFHGCEICGTLRPVFS